ncbi:MAG TPA: hypothetical protein VFW89_03545 [Gemmatimonadaceae bacterium]|nr:hypothetical protein [Gemmatimonadaceae bacterium]
MAYGVMTEAADRNRRRSRISSSTITVDARKVPAMPLWDKVKQELDRAGQAAQGALDEGKTRLDALRARQLANKAAQALGYAVYRARQKGGDIDADTYARLSSTLAGHEAEAAGLEQRLDSFTEGRRAKPSDSDTTDFTASADAPPSPDSPEPPPAA